MFFLDGGIAQSRPPIRKGTPREMYGTAFRGVDRSDRRSHRVFVIEKTRALGGIISANALEIERRWLERVEKSVARTQNIEPTLLRDGISDYLAALSAALHSGAD